MRSKGKGLDKDVAVAVLQQMLSALNYYHNESRIHRNLRASNVLLDLDGNVGLEMSLAATNENWDRKSSNTRNTYVGSPGWMAPEMLQQESGYDFKVDIWALGITAIELAEGQPPYPHLKPLKVLMMVLHKPPPSTSRFGVEYADFVQQCLEKDPQQRWHQIPVFNCNDHSYHRMYFVFQAGHRNTDATPAFPNLNL